MLKKKVFFPVLALAIIGTALASSSFVSAQDTNGPDSLITAIAQKFNLNETDVKSVFEEQRSKHQAERKAAVEQKLTQAVADGKITEAQKQAILAKVAANQDNKPNFEEFKNLTPEQRREKMEQKRTEMENWAKQNGLSLETLHELTGGPQGHGKGMMFKIH